MRGEIDEVGDARGRERRERALLEAATAWLAARGAEVRVFAEAENCVRRRDPGVAPFVVEVQGVPNLLHELAHVVLLGRVEQDHATEYARIPFDLACEHGRALLFDELACCVASCAWHPGDDEDAKAWFAEQVGIQHVFFGFAELPRFLAAADVPLRTHARDLAATIARALSGVELALRSAGAPAETARPRRSIDPHRWWQSLARLP